MPPSAAPPRSMPVRAGPITHHRRPTGCRGLCSRSPPALAQPIDAAMAAAGVDGGRQHDALVFVYNGTVQGSNQNSDAMMASWCPCCLTSAAGWARHGHGHAHGARGAMVGGEGGGMRGVAKPPGQRSAAWWW